MKRTTKALLLQCRYHRQGYTASSGSDQWLLRALAQRIRAERARYNHEKIRRQIRLLGLSRF